MMTNIRQAAAGYIVQFLSDVKILPRPTSCFRERTNYCI